jgi:putative DNA-invertase from lambdoid prophage Rac
MHREANRVLVQTLVVNQIVAVLAQVAEMECQRINERTAAGRKLAKETLAATGKTHKGKESMGRPAKADAAEVKA